MCLGAFCERSSLLPVIISEGNCGDALSACEAVLQDGRGQGTNPSVSYIRSIGIRHGRSRHAPDEAEA